MRRVSLFAGLLLVMAGVFWIFMLFGFARMMDPAIQGAARESASWRRVTSDGTFPFGVLLIIAGGWLMFSRPRRCPPLC